VATFKLLDSLGKTEIGMFSKYDNLASLAGKLGGAKGGPARAKKIGKRRRREIARLGGVARQAARADASSSDKVSP